MAQKRISGGVAHKVPTDLREALVAHTKSLDAWEDITPLARNEFLCWIEDARKPETRAHRIKRTYTEIAKGKRRPCCWPGCPHR